MSSLSDILKNIRPLDKAAMAKVRERQDRLTKPRGSLGALEDLSIKLAGIRADPMPVVDRKAVITMAADHGVAGAGVSLYPQEVTRQMVLNFIKGGAAINVLAKMIDARVVVVDMGVIGGCPATEGLICRMIDFGTRDMSREPAMTSKQAVDSIEAGVAVVESEIEKGLDIIGTGDMGIGNSTAASAIIASITQQPVASVTGRGTGVDNKQLNHKIEIIEKALLINRPDYNDPIDVLSKVGGFEIGGLVGVILAAAAHRIPVIIDGFISGSAALIAVKICPQVKDYMVASHLSAENGHSICLGHMGLKPLLNLNMRLGEGTGAVFGIFLAQAAINVLKQMATFEEAAVSDIQNNKGGH